MGDGEAERHSVLCTLPAGPLDEPTYMCVLTDMGRGSASGHQTGGRRRRTATERAVGLGQCILQTT